MDLHLAGKTAVVTGASRGIGLAITQALADAGAYVVAGSRSRGPELGALQEAGKVRFVSADLSIPNGATDLVAAAEDGGGIDVLVNNAGALTVHPAGFTSLDDDDWQASWDLNVMGVVRTTRAALPAMYKRGGGSIVIVDPSTPTTPTRHLRLLRNQGRRHEHSQGIVKGIGPEEHSRQLRQPWTSVDRDVARRWRGRRLDRRRQR